MSEPASGAQAVDRAAALLTVIVESPGPCTFTVLVDRLGLAKSTTSRLLHALENAGLVQRDRSGSYRPGALFAVYAARRGAAGDLTELLQPALDALAETTGETINFAVPRGDAVVQVAQADGRYLLGATNWVGVEVPAHCSALGKVFYAEGMLRLPAGPLERRTERTVTDPADLARQLDEIRRRGYAVAWEELEVGLVAIAAPVRSGDGAALGAISVSGPTARLPRERLADVAGQLLAGARQASESLRRAPRHADHGGRQDARQDARHDARHDTGPGGPPGSRTPGTATGRAGAA